MKKSLVSLLVFALVFTMVAPAFAAVNDIGNSYAKEEIEALIEAGIIGGYEDGTFKPANAITRAEFAKILALSLELEENATAANVFTDVPAWAKGYVGALVEAELTTGLTATTYGSSQNITREQLATFFVRALGYEEAAEELDLTPAFNDAANVAPYAKANVAFASEIGFINGLPNGNFDPKGNAQRQAVARLAYEFYFNADEYHAAAEELIKENAPVPAQIDVESVKASNLKQVEVTFNGAVDKETALETFNYTIDGFTFDDLLPQLSADEKTVTLTVAEDSDKFENQEEIEIVINGVLSKDKETEVTDKKVKFTPVDNTIPTVAEVKALGPKALHIVFSEPVKEDSARSLVNYKIDDQSLSGNVIYSYPNEVIIETTMTLGEHKLSVLNVEDYFGLKVAQSGIEFTVQEDTEAPEITEVISKDLLGLEIHFDEPVKSIGKVYHTTDVAAHRDSQPTVRSNKVIAGFDNPMAVNGTTVYAVDVVDYNGNKATRSIEVKPEIDTTRPTVTHVKLDTVNNNHVLTLKFNKVVDRTEAQKAANYTVYDKDDKKVSGKGLSNGNPIQTPVYENSREVKIELLGKLSAGEYTIEVTNVKDTSYMQNTILPQKLKFTVGDTNAPKINKAWSDETKSNNNSRVDQFIYVEFSKEMAHEGTGNVLDIAKFMYSLDTDSVTGEPTNFKPFPTNTTINSAGNNTYKISLPRVDAEDAKVFTGIRAQLVSDRLGNFPAELYLVQEVLGKEDQTIKVDSVEATSRTEITVEFDSIVSVDARDFKLTRTEGSDIFLTLVSAGPVNGVTVAKFRPNNQFELPTNPEAHGYRFETTGTNHSRNSFGLGVDETDAPVIDAIAPSPTNLDGKSFNIYNTASDKQVVVAFNEPVKVVSPSAVDIVSVKVGGTEVLVKGINHDANGRLVITLSSTGDNVDRKNGTGTVTLNSNSQIDVEVKAANEAGKIVVDLSSKANAVKGFTRSALYSNVQVGAPVAPPTQDELDQAAVDSQVNQFQDTFTVSELTFVLGQLRVENANIDGSVSVSVLVESPYLTYSPTSTIFTATNPAEGEVDAEVDVTLTFTKGNATATHVVKVTVPAAE